MPLQIVACEREGARLGGAVPVGKGCLFDLERDGAFRWIDDVAPKMTAHAERSVLVFLGRAAEFVAGGKLDAICPEDFERVPSVCSEDQNTLRVGPVRMDARTVRQQIVRRCECPGPHQRGASYRRGGLSRHGRLCLQFALGCNEHHVEQSVQYCRKYLHLLFLVEGFWTSRRPIVEQTALLCSRIMMGSEYS